MAWAKAGPPVPGLGAPVEAFVEAKVTERVGQRELVSSVSESYHWLP